MIGELVCPDCGGIVGATERTEAGAPCRCFADASLASVSGSLSGTTAGVDVGDAPPPPVLKVCRTCGKDLNGHRRVKDGQGGYQCVPCAKETEKEENYGRVRCRVCGHLVKEERLTEYEGTKMCPNCHDQRTAMRRQQIQRMGFRSARTREELRQIYIMSAIGVGLALLATVGLIIRHFHH